MTEQEDTGKTMKIIEKISAKSGEVQIIETSQGPVGAQHLVEVTGDGWEIRRWFFFDEFDEKEAKRFGVKTINDIEFRQQSLDQQTTWTQVQNLYLEAEQTIVSTFEAKSLFEYAASDFEGERRIAWAEHKLLRLLKETYDSISYVIEEFSLSPATLRPYLEAQFEAAQGVAAMIDSESSASIEEVRPDDRLLECRSPSTQEWILEDLRTEIVTAIDVYLGEHRPVVALRSPPQKKDIIKDLKWDATHREWNPEREVWEIDLDSLDYTIESLVSRNSIVRVSEPVAHLADIETPDRPNAIRPDDCLPTMKPDSYGTTPSATDLLSLPGIGPAKARALLDEGFISIPEIAHSSVSELREAKGIGEASGQIAKQGAQAAVGQREPAALRLASQTPLSVSMAQQEIAKLAARGVPQTESTTRIIGFYQSNLPKLELDLRQELYSLYRDGYLSIEEIATAGKSELEQIEYLDEDLAERIHNEAREFTSNTAK